MRRLQLFVVAAAGVAVVAAATAGAAMSPVVSSKLSGKNEVPSGAPAGSGIVILHLSTAKGTVCWDFKNVKGVVGPSAAHIHKGGPGKAGPVVVPFGAAYKGSGCTKAPAAVIEAIETHPNAYYVNVHNAKYPGGAVRGQLVAGMIG